MKAMQLRTQAPVAEAPLRLTELPDPMPGAGQVVLRVEACGVCHTDLHIVEGDLPMAAMPLIPGHQIVGKVESVGEGVEGVSPGERLGAAWLGSTCGHCRFCRTGRENLCGKAGFTGYDFQGGFAEKAVVFADYAYQVPEGFPSEQAAPLLCGGIIGYRALRLAGLPVPAGDASGFRLGLYGFGASAHVAIQAAVHLGCEVYVLSRGAGHRRLAEELGAAWTGVAPEPPPVKLDASIIFAPAGELVPTALKDVDRGGKVVVAGIHMSDTPGLSYQDHLYFEKSLQSVTASTRQDGAQLLAMAAAVPIGTRVNSYPLTEVNTALRDLKEGRVNGAAVVVL